MSKRSLQFCNPQRKKRESEPLKYAFFPGCVIPQRENAYELSARKVAEKLGLQLVDLKGANCCGFFLDSIDHLGATILAARDLSLAEESGCDIITLCPACSGHLTRVRADLLKDRELRNKVNKTLGKINKKFKGSSKVKHFTGVLLEDVGVEKIRSTVTKPLKQLKVAPHYGCHIMKPSDEIQFDDPEDPKLLNSLIEVTGAERLDYMEKKLCCGAPTVGVDEKLALKIVHKKLENIKRVQADAVTTVCQFCHLHFDINQLRIEEEFSEKYQIPILHYTQLLGLAQGYSFEEIGLYENRVPIDKILDKLSL